MIPGVTMNFGGTDYIVPPLTLGALELLQDRLLNFRGDLSDASVVIDALHAALKRNYPDITRANVTEMIDVGNFVEVFESVMDIGGMKRKAQATVSGEAKAV